MILGTWESPDEYRLWGAWENDPNVTAYNEWIRLREVETVEPTRKRRPHRTSNVSGEGNVTKRRRTTAHFDDNYLDRNDIQTPSAASNKHSLRNSLGQFTKSPLDQVSAGGGDDDEKPPLGLQQPPPTRQIPQLAHTALSNTNLALRSASPSQVAGVQTLRLQPHDLSAAYEAIRTHAAGLTDHHGQPITTNEISVRAHLRSLEHYADRADDIDFDNAAMSNIIRRALDRDLASLGYPALPKT